VFQQKNLLLNLVKIYVGLCYTHFYRTRVS